MGAKVKITQKEKEVFEYLNELRETGEINMFGAAPYVAEEFGLPLKEARSCLTKWMSLFSELGYDHLEVEG